MVLLVLQLNFILDLEVSEYAVKGGSKTRYIDPSETFAGDILEELDYNDYSAFKYELGILAAESANEANAHAETGTTTLTLASDKDINNAISQAKRLALFTDLNGKITTSGILITSVSSRLNETKGYEITITVPNISTGYTAITYGFYDSLEAMEPETFEAFL